MIFTWQLPAQEPLNVPAIALPQNICGCSDEEANHFQESVANALEVVKGRYNQESEDEADQKKLVEKALKATGGQEIDYNSLANMNEAQQQAYAAKMTAKAMQQTSRPATVQSQKELQAQFEKAQRNSDDASTMQALLMPVAFERNKLEKESELYYEKNIAPLQKKLENLYGTEHTSMLNRIKTEEKKYCAQFSPRNIQLIGQEVDALKKLNPVLQEYLARNFDYELSSEFTVTEESDPFILYLKVIGKAFEYRIHYNSKEEVDRMHSDQ